MWSLNKNLKVKVAVALIKNVKINNSNKPFQELQRIAKDYLEKYKDYQISMIPNVHYSRDLFKSIGLDPTKRRPSSESLLRRAVKEKPFYQVNTLVDIGNWCSLEFLLPICVYDADKIIGDVKVDIGSENDEYAALNNEVINFKHRYVLKDQQGPFGAPMTDSKRTSVSTDSKNIYLLITAPESYPTADLKSNQNVFIERVVELCSGEIDYKSILDNN